MSPSRPYSPVSIVESNDVHEEVKLQCPASPSPSYSTTLRGTSIVEYQLKDDIELQAKPLRNDSIVKLDSDRTASEEISTNGYKLRQSRRSKLLLWLINIALLILPFMFLVLAFLAVNMDGSTYDVSRYWVVQVAQVGPTIYPIMFAAIMGRLMCDIALYRAERGIRLGTIEQLIQSTSLAGSVKAAFFLRNRTVWGLVIIIVWCFSPVGGQSSLRCLSVAHAPSKQNATLIYATGINIPFSAGDHAIVESTLQAAVLAPNVTKRGPRDSWQNPKIPFVPAVVYDESDIAEHAPPWYDFKGNSSDDYASLIGVPIWNLAPRGTANFTIQSTFLHTECQKQGADEWYTSCALNSSNHDPFCALRRFNGEISSEVAQWNLDWKGGLLKKTDPEAYVKLNVFTNCTYNYTDTSKHTVEAGNCSATYVCDIKSRHVDVNMTCADGLCEANAVRRSASVNTPSFITPWNEWLDITPGGLQRDQWTLANISNAWPNGSQIDALLAGSDQPELPQDIDYFLPNASATNVSIRATQLLNSYWLSTTYTRDLFKFINLAPSYKSDNYDGNRTFYEPVPIHISTDRIIYKAHKVWVILLTYVSFILVMCTIASIIMRSKTVSPDILGYASSLTRDSEYFEHYQTGSTLDGLERARALQDTKVYIADVLPHMKTGRIAFSTGVTDGMPHGRLSKDRTYE